MQIPLPWRRLLKNAPALAATRYHWLVVAGACSLILVAPLVTIPWPILAMVIAIQVLLGWAALRDLRVLTEWRRARCVIQSAGVSHTVEERYVSRNDRRVEEHHYDAAIEYTFTINYGAGDGGRGAIEEETITGRRLSNFRFQQNGSEYATRVASFFRPGDPAFCWYNPGNPQESVLLRAPLWFYAPLLFPWSSLATVAVGYLGLKAARLQTPALKSAHPDLFSEAPWRRLEAVRSLASWRDSAALDLLIDVALDRDEYPRIARAACDALADWDDSQAMAALGAATFKTHLKEAALAGLTKQLNRGIVPPESLDLGEIAMDTLTDADLRSTAIGLLVRLRDSRAIGALLPMLASEDEQQRKESLQALDSINAQWRSGPQARTSIRHFVSVLRDSSAVARRYAVSALVQIGLPAVDEITTFLAAGFSRNVVSMDAVGALAGIGDRRAVPFILRAAQIKITEGLIEALGSFEDAATVPLLGELLNDPEAKLVHGKASAALARIGNHAAALQLLGAVPTTGKLAANALLKVENGWESSTEALASIPSLLRMIDDPSVGLREASVAILNRIDPNWRARMDWRSRPEIHALTSPMIAIASDSQTSSSERVAAAKGLGHLDDHRALVALQAVFDSPRSDVGMKQAAVEGISRQASRSAEARDLLTQALAQPFTRGLAALGLARAGTSEALQALTLGIADEFPELRSAHASDPVEHLLQCLRKHSYYEKVVWALEGHQAKRALP